VNDAMGSKKKTVMVTSDPFALIAEKMKVNKSKKKVVVSSDEADDFSELKKITTLLAKAFNRRKFYSKPTNNNLRTSSTSYVKCYNYKKEGHFAKDCKKVKVKDYEYYKTKMLLAKKDKNEQVLLAEDQAWMESKKYAKLEAERYEYMSRYSTYFDNDKQHRKQIVDQEVLYDKMSVQLVELDKHVRDLKNTVLEKDFKISELKECVRNKDLEIEKYLEHLNIYENKLQKIGQTNQTIHMIMPSKDNLYYGRKGIGFENPSYFEKAKDLRPTLYDEKVIGLGYTPMFLTHSDEALEIEKFKRSRENKIEFAYDYGNLNASYVNEKIIFEDDYFPDIINLDFEKIDSPFQQTSSLKLYVPNVILEKIIIDLEDKVMSILEKEKVNLKTIESLKSKGFESSETAISELENQSENDCLVVENELNDTSSTVNHSAYMASAPQIEYAPITYNPSEFSSPETGLVVPVFQKGADPIDAINHMISFLTSVVASRYPATNNQLRTSSNPRQQVTINNGRVTIQPIQGRQNFVSAGSSRPFTSVLGGAPGKQRVLQEEELEFLADPAKVALMANLSHYSSDTLAEERVLVITALKEQLNKLKGKSVLTEAVSLNPIDPALLQVDIAPLVPKLRKNRTAHTDYFRHTQEEAATLREIVESKRLLSPLNTSLAYA
nr:hypothetical protein [Tanacetum cinerariifolium]